MNKLSLAATCVLACMILVSQGPRAGGHPPARTAVLQNNHESPKQNMPGMPGMDMGGDHPSTGMGGMGDMGKTNSQNPTNSAAGSQRAEADAVHSMQPGHHMDGAHMHMTPPRPATAADRARAAEIVTSLRAAIEKYKDYRVALADGYRIFLPKLPQPMYHFTNYWNGFLEGFTFDSARPTSLLYKKTKDGYELIGAMYTATKTASLEQLDERVPLGVAQWHAHINLCMPKLRDGGKVDWARFGLNGSIATAQACSEAGGRFYPQIFGWMVHVYPFEASPDKIWVQ